MNSESLIAEARLCQEYYVLFFQANGRLGAEKVTGACSQANKIAYCASPGFLGNETLCLADCEAATLP